MTANFIPEWVLTVADWIIFTMHGLLNPHEDLQFAIKVKGEL